MNLSDRLTTLERNQRAMPLVDFAAARKALSALLDAHRRGEPLPQIDRRDSGCDSEARRKLLVLLERKAAERRRGTEDASSLQ